MNRWDFVWTRDGFRDVYYNIYVCNRIREKKKKNGATGKRLCREKPVWKVSYGKGEGTDRIATDLNLLKVRCRPLDLPIVILQTINRELDIQTSSLTQRGNEGTLWLGLVLGKSGSW